MTLTIRSTPELGGKGHHKQLTPQDIRYLRSKGCIPVRLNNLSRGTQVFWLSRTVHSGMCHLPGAEHNWRMVLYVSALPKNLKGFNWPKIDAWRPTYGFFVARTATALSRTICLTPFAFSRTTSLIQRGLFLRVL